MGRVSSAARDRVIEHVARAVLTLDEDRVARVGIDGVDGAGKTTFADELAERIADTRPVIRASVDGFHNPRAVRYRLGRDSPEGFFSDSYDYQTLRAILLDPLGPGGTGRFKPAAFDHERDAAVDSSWLQAQPRSLLIFDGIFLHRPELRDYWDLSVYLRVPWEKNHHLANAPGNWSDPTFDGNRRYLEGQAIHLHECRPEERATIVVDNVDPRAPQLIVDRRLRERPRSPFDGSAAPAPP